MPQFLVDIADLPYDPADAYSIEEWGKSLCGKTLREVAEQTGQDVREVGGKGRFGHSLEIVGFRYKPNSEPGPDFPAASVEVKSLPIIPSTIKRKDPNGWKPKERLQLHDIDYMSVHLETWEDCSLRAKCGVMLIITDEYEKSANVLDYRIRDAFLLDFPLSEDEPTLRADWLYVQRMVNEGRAHEISASATTYLDVARHGNADTPLRPQPFSEVGAQKRGFGLKNSYIREIYAAAMQGKPVHTPPVEQYVYEVASIELPLEEKVRRSFAPYVGMTNYELAERFGYKTGAKNLNELVGNRALGLKRADRASELNRAGYELRNVNFEPTGTLTESLPFPYIRIEDLLAEECWEDSLFREQITSRFCMTIWQKIMSKYRWVKTGGSGAVPAVLRGVAFVGIPDAVVDTDGAKVWNKTRKLFALSTLAGLPALDDDCHFHVRPHANKNQPPMVFPDGSTATKQCFWVNASYVKELVLATEDGAEIEVGQ